ncbi:hypothetical protein Tco_0461810 [Tanacetum coccineum]
MTKSYIKDTTTSSQVVSHPPFPISPINSHVTHTQDPPQSDNQTSYIKDTPTSPQVVSHPSLPISPINSHVTHTQALPQSDNQTQHTPPLSPSRESLIDDINQLQDLSNLLAMHLSQQQNNIPSSPYSPNLPHTLNINQVETHVRLISSSLDLIHHLEFKEIIPPQLPPLQTLQPTNLIHAKVEGKTIVISESSVRRDLQFDDEDGIACLTNTKIFENLQLMGYEKLSEKLTFYKPYFSSMETQADMGEGSGQPTDPQHTSTSVQPSNEEPITVPSSSQPKKTHRPRKAKRATEISQSSGPIPLVADETVTKEREDIMERAATTASSLEAKQDSDMDEVFKDVEGDAEQVISAVADEVSTGDAINTAGTEVNTASVPVTTAGVSVSTAEPITTASVNITIAEPTTPPTTTVFEEEDLIIAQTLVKIKSEKSKVRGVVMQEPSKTVIRPTIPPQQHNPKDKGKDSFVPVDSKVVKGSKDIAEGSETRAEGSSKRAGEDLQQESTKKQNMDDDKEKEELKQCFEIVPDDGDDVTIDATPLVDGKTQMYLTFSKMLKNFDREDLEVLWKIVKARFKETKLVDYMDTFLLLTLKIMFEHHVEDEVWKRQENVSTYKAHTTSDVLYVKLQLDYECEMAFDLLR